MHTSWRCGREVVIRKNKKHTQMEDLLIVVLGLCYCVARLKELVNFNFSSDASNFVCCFSCIHIMSTPTCFLRVAVLKVKCYAASFSCIGSLADLCRTLLHAEEVVEPAE